MPRSRDILRRFRPAGTPGAPSAAGVPADRVAELSAELEPVLALLAAAQQEADRIRRDAEQEAEQIRQRAAERAGALVLTAQRDAAAERADAALRVRRLVDEETAAALAAAEQGAQDLTRTAEQNMNAFVDRVLTEVRGNLASAGETGT